MDFILDYINTFRELIYNTILVFSLGFIYSTTNIGFKNPTKTGKIFAGILIGIITFIIMLFPWIQSEGLVFDTRTIMMAVTGYFFGPLTAGIAMIIPVTYRIIIGGVGVYSGVANIVFAALLGLAWHKIRKTLPAMNHFLEYYLFGLMINVMSLLVFIFFIQWPIGLEAAKTLWAPYLLLFPVIIMLLAKVLENQSQRLIAHQTILDQQILIQASIDSTKTMEIYALDKDYQYLAYNKFHQKNMQKYYHATIKKGANYLSYIENPRMKERLQKNILKAFNGEAFAAELLLEIDQEKYLLEQYSPIYDEHQDIIGVTVFSQDISERKRYEASMLYLSYHDSLTSLYNRRYYIEQIPKFDQPQYYPLSVAIVDINGLKIMNDAFGHLAGDTLLQKVAHHLLAVIEDDKKIMRTGGDEFAVFLPKMTHDDAVELMEEFKKRIEDDMVHGMHMSISFGLATKVKHELIDEVLNDAENDMYAQKLFEVTSYRHKTIETILSTLHEKNPREEMHSMRVSALCQKIGQALDMPKEQLNLLEAISELHDIGKIAIDDAIINKPGKLDDHEWEMIKKHPEIGYRILSTSPEYSEIALDILSHHERYDGKGYPRGLKGEQIPLRARIISVADAYDAMVSERPYRKPLTHEQAIEEVKINLGAQFDPMIGQLFIDLMSKSEIAI